MLYLLLTQTQAHRQGEGNLTRARFPSITNNQIDNNNIAKQKKSSIVSSPNTNIFPITTLQGERNLKSVSFTCSTNTSILPTTTLHAKRNLVHAIFRFNTTTSTLLVRTFQGEGTLTHVRFPSIINNQITNNNIAL